MAKHSPAFLFSVSWECVTHSEEARIKADCRCAINFNLLRKSWSWKCATMHLEHFSYILFTISFCRMIGCCFNGPVLTKQYALSLYLVLLFIWTHFIKQKTKGIISGGSLGTLPQYTACWDNAFWEIEFYRHSGKFSFPLCQCRLQTHSGSSSVEQIDFNCSGL